MVEPVLKRKDTDVGDAIFESPPPHARSCRSMHLWTVFHSSGGQLLNKGLHLWASLTKRHSESKEGVSSGERAPMFVLLLDCVYKAFSCVASSIIQIGPDARVGIMISSGSALSRSRGLLPKNAPASVVTSIFIGGKGHPVVH